jgi:hypothetical protein
VARPKTLRAEPVTKSIQEAEAKVRKHLRNFDFIDPRSGLSIDTENFSALGTLAEIAADPSQRASDRLNAAKALAVFFHPPLSHLQISSTHTENHNIRVKSFSVGANDKIIDASSSQVLTEVEQGAPMPTDQELLRLRGLPAPDDDPGEE